jgi:hypothetical protein
MLYYSMQVLWPRQSALLYVPADRPILRGVYANLTLMGTWGEENQYVYGISAFES